MNVPAQRRKSEFRAGNPEGPEVLTYEYSVIIIKWLNVTNLLQMPMGVIILKKGRLLLFLSLLLLMVSVSAVPASADWVKNKNGTKVRYADETGSYVTGLIRIGKYTYYFNSRGYLQTGWVTSEDGLRYFETEGKAGGKLGRMLKGGVVRVGKHLYGFGSDGVVLNGLNQVGKYWYYFYSSKTPGTGGRAAAGKFVTLPDGRRAYFMENGRMARKKWVKNKKYYVDASGNLLRNTVAPGGYVVNAKGRVLKKVSNEFFKLGGKTYFYKKKILKDRVFRYKGNYYYVDPDGVRRTGWIIWRGNKYYFYKNGKAATGRAKVGGVYYEFNSKGQLQGEESDTYSTGTKATTGKASILILCGHGQGDSGAVGSNSCGTFYENKQTREFGTLVYENLKNSGKVDAYLFNKNYDMYQQMRSVLNTYYSTSYVTGTGKNRKKTLSAIAKSSVIPDPTKYDYVLEIHFNATGTASKDPSGNGSKKGTGTYVNVHKTSTARAVDRKIIRYLNNCGLNTWGAGVYGSDGLLNARVFQEIGVNYSLLETCFIDDNDDMKFYIKSKSQMAKQVAQAVIDYFK